MKLKFKRQMLLDTLTANQTAFNIAFKRANEGFLTQLALAMAEQLKFIEAGNVDKVDLNFIHKAEIEKPQDHSDDYRRAIKAISASDGDEVELDDKDYVPIVCDEWSWRKHWEISNTKYLR